MSKYELKLPESAKGIVVDLGGQKVTLAEYKKVLENSVIETEEQRKQAQTVLDLFAKYGKYAPPGSLGIRTLAELKQWLGKVDLHKAVERGRALTNELVKADDSMDVVNYKGNSYMRGEMFSGLLAEALLEQGMPKNLAIIVAMEVLGSVVEINTASGNIDDPNKAIKVKFKETNADSSKGEKMETKDIAGEPQTVEEWNEEQKFFSPLHAHKVNGEYCLAIESVKRLIKFCACQLPHKEAEELIKTSTEIIEQMEKATNTVDEIVKKHGLSPSDSNALGKSFRKAFVNANQEISTKDSEQIEKKSEEKDIEQKEESEIDLEEVAIEYNRIYIDSWAIRQWGESKGGPAKDVCKDLADYMDSDQFKKAVYADEKIRLEELLTDVFCIDPAPIEVDQEGKPAITNGGEVVRKCLYMISKYGRSEDGFIFLTHLLREVLKYDNRSDEALAEIYNLLTGESKLE
ncbi:MAG: hypothetical protein LUC43_07810 [Burkholderiales bacterium]|nr:hypothetical protein [Burkholderiales bacterium]